MRDFIVMTIGMMVGLGVEELFGHHYVAGAVFIAITVVTYGALTWRERDR